MKINRLLDPVQTGANGGATTTVAPAQTTTQPPDQTTPPATTAPVAPPNPGEAAKAARAERLSRDIFEEPSETQTTDATKTTTTPTTTQQTTTQVPAVQLSQEQLAQIVAARNQPEQRQQQPQLTQEEIDKQLAVVKVTAEMCTELGLPAEAAPFLDKLAKAIVTNAVRMSNVIVEQKHNNLMQTLQPHISFAQQQQHLMLEHQFSEAHPDLKGYDPVIKDVAMKLKASGFKGSQKQAFDKIAEDTRTYLKSMGIDPVVKSNGTGGATTTQNPKPTMSTVSSGSQGGAGGAPKGDSKETWKDIWEK